MLLSQQPDNTHGIYQSLESSSYYATNLGVSRRCFSQMTVISAFMLQKIYLGEASVVAILLPIISYLLLRALVARLTGRKKGRP